MRVPLAVLRDLPWEFRDAFDGESVDRTSAGPLAVLILNGRQTRDLQALSEDMENLGSLADYLVRFAPLKTLRRKADHLGAYASLMSRLDLPAAERGPDPCVDPVTSLLPYDEYHTLVEGVCFINNLAQAYPNIAEVVSIGQSIEGREIWALKITDNPAVVEPEEEKILFTGVTHAREWITFEMILYLAEYLTTRYDDDPQVRHIVDNSVVWLVPAVNPDGYEYTWTTNRMWRKNRRCEGHGCPGVDINRNYDYKWGYNDWGSSPDSHSQIYRGPYPASEPETQAIQNLLADEKFAVGVSYHSYSQLCLYAWGYVGAVLPESYASFRAMGKKYVSLVYGVHGKVYTPGQSNYTIYATNGDFDDYAYGAQGVLAFTPELRPTSSGEGGFLLPEEQILPTVEENTAPALWLMLNVASAFDYQRSGAEPLIETPAIGANMFSLPATPTNQKPGTALDYPMPWADRLRTWLDDTPHQPPGWDLFDGDYENAGFEGCGAGSGYVVDIGDFELLSWANGLNTYRVLPYVFEDGAEITLSNYEPGLNLIGIPAREPLLMHEISVVRRILTNMDNVLNYGEQILAERTALEDMNATRPWIDWTWQYQDSAGGRHYAHPTGAGGADEYVHPFRAYEINVQVTSRHFGSHNEDQPIYHLSLPGFNAFAFPDCNYNATPDADDIATGYSHDCNGNSIPDECDLITTGTDCNDNGTLDECDIAAGSSDDCSGNGIPDECEPDCNHNGSADSCDILAEISADCSGNGIPDECEPDCNGNGSADSCDVLAGFSPDCDLNETPDECQPGLFVPARVAASGYISAEFIDALERAGHVVRLLDRRQPLPDYLSRYDVLALGHGCAGAEPADEQKIDDFIATGGGLIMFGGSTNNYHGAGSPFLSGSGWIWRENTLVVDPNAAPAFQLPATSTLNGYSTIPELKPGAEIFMTWQDGVAMGVTFAYQSGRIVYFNNLWAAYHHNWHGDEGYGAVLMRNTLAYISPTLAHDCNNNGLDDACDIYTSLSTDTNENWIPDECEVPGDLNCDNVVSFADIGCFVQTMTDPDAYQLEYPNCDINHADLNGDGSLNSLDIDPFVDLLTGQ